MTRAAMFAAMRPYAPGKRIPPEDVAAIDAIADRWGMPRIDGSPLTVRVMGELIHHEAIVLEAYKDSEGIWTWGIGLTAASGVDPLAFKDKPATVDQVLKAFVNVTRRRYVQPVLNAFGGRKLTEEQFAAALSFHYNTGAIERTDWVKLWLAGRATEAKAFLRSHYLNGGDLQGRRNAEAALFFDGVWKGDGTALVIPVAKPSYQPAFAKAKRVPIASALAGALL